MAYIVTFIEQCRRLTAEKSAPTENNCLLARITKWQRETPLAPFYSMHQLMGIFNTPARFLGPQLSAAGWTKKHTYRVNQPSARFWVPPTRRI